MRGFVVPLLAFTVEMLEGFNSLYPEDESRLEKKEPDVRGLAVVLAVVLVLAPEFFFREGIVAGEIGFESRII